MKASDLAAQVAGILAAREGQHGPKVPNMQRIADIWNAILGAKLNLPILPSDVCALMIGMKIARNQVGDKGHMDNPLDAMGYAAIWGECLAHEVGQVAEVEPLRDHDASRAARAAHAKIVAETVMAKLPAGPALERIRKALEPDYDAMLGEYSAARPNFYGGLDNDAAPAGTQIKAAELRVSPMGVEARDTGIAERIAEAGE